MILRRVIAHSSNEEWTRQKSFVIPGPRSGTRNPWGLRVRAQGWIPGSAGGRPGMTKRNGHAERMTRAAK